MRRSLHHKNRYLLSYHILLQRCISMKKMLCSLFLAAILGLLAGCAKTKSLEEQIIGNWELQEGKHAFYSVTFYDDGTMDAGYSDTFAEWNIVNGNILKWTWSGYNYLDGTQETYLLSFDGDTMVWTDPENEENQIIYVRAD